MTTTPLTEQQLDEYAAAVATYQQHPSIGFACCSAHPVADAGAALLDEVRRLRTDLDRRTEDVAFLERVTLPELRREIEHHKDGKQRWRGRAEKAEATLERVCRVASRLANHAVGFQDVLDDSDRDPWAKTVGADIAELTAALSPDPAPAPASAPPTASHSPAGDRDGETATEAPEALLRDAEHYLSATHGSVARHDNLAANYGCAGCQLRDKIQAQQAGGGA